MYTHVHGIVQYTYVSVCTVCSAPQLSATAVSEIDTASDEVVHSITPSVVKQVWSMVQSAPTRPWWTALLPKGQSEEAILRERYVHTHLHTLIHICLHVKSINNAYFRTTIDLPLTSVSYAYGYYVRTRIRLYVCRCFEDVKVGVATKLLHLCILVCDASSAFSSLLCDLLQEGDVLAQVARGLLSDDSSTVGRALRVIQQTDRVPTFASHGLVLEHYCCVCLLVLSMTSFSLHCTVY